MSGRTDTHDMGFIVQPALQKDWEVTGDKESLDAVVRAGYALASRYDERVGAIRSWDVAVNGRYEIVDRESDFLVIIDSMCSECPPFTIVLSILHHQLCFEIILLTWLDRSRPPLLHGAHQKRPHPQRYRNPARRFYHPRDSAPRLLLLSPCKLRSVHGASKSQNDQPRLAR